MLHSVAPNGKSYPKRPSILSPVKINNIRKISGCLAKNPKKRPIIKELLEHPWMAKHCKGVSELKDMAAKEDPFEVYTAPESKLCKEEVKK